MFFKGQQQFLDRHVEIFKGMFAKTVLNQEVVSLRFLNPDVAIVETLTWVSGFPKGGSPKAIHIDDKGRLHTRLLQVFQKQTGGWKIVVYHNVDLKRDTPVPAHWKVYGHGGAAEVLNMHVSTLNSRIKKLGIEKVRANKKDA